MRGVVVQATEKGFSMHHWKPHISRSTSAVLGTTYGAPPSSDVLTLETTEIMSLLSKCMGMEVRKPERWCIILTLGVEVETKNRNIMISRAPCFVCNPTVWHALPYVLIVGHHNWIAGYLLVKHNVYGRSSLGSSFLRTQRQQLGRQQQPFYVGPVALVAFIPPATFTTPISRISPVAPVFLFALVALISPEQLQPFVEFLFEMGH